MPTGDWRKDKKDKPKSGIPSPTAEAERQARANIAKSHEEYERRKMAAFCRGLVVTLTVAVTGPRGPETVEMERRNLLIYEDQGAYLYLKTTEARHMLNKQAFVAWHLHWEDEAGVRHSDPLEDPDT